MKIEDVENLAELAKIELNREEKEQTLRDMDEILNYVKIIEGVKVEEVEPEYPLRNVWREDETKSSFFSPDLIIKQFPDSKDGFLKVKKIL